ncbi:MAG: TIGR03915 family putative DNA repair protein, partial [Chitinispirillia bacterium]
KCSAESRKNWRLMLCSGRKERNVLMARYLAALVKYQGNTEKKVHDTRVFNIHKHVRNISREVDRMLGLLRFEETVNGSYYSVCEPDHDIISILAIHFKNRMPEESWVIHDKKRYKAVIFQNKSISAVSVPQPKKPDISQRESYFRYIWKTYFKTICISERTNKKLQQNFIPNRYRKYLPELNS